MVAVLYVVLLFWSMRQISAATNGLHLMNEINRLKHILKRVALCPIIDPLSRTLGYRRPYRPDTRCEWTIQIPSDSVLTITITELQIETDSSTSHNTSCPYDSLTINDVSYCGDWVPPNFSITIRNQDSAIIKFVSDGTKEYDGFKLQYQFGLLQNNNNPVDPHQSNPHLQPIRCMQSEAGCCSNYCQHGYMNYPTIDCPQNCLCKNSLEVDCGLEFECTIAWSSGAYACPYCACFNVQKLNSLFDGFVAVDRTCGQTLSMASSIIGSSLAEGNYRANEECVATIPNGPESVNVLLTYDLEEEGTCSFDSISIGPRKFCGKGTHLYRIEQTNDLLVKFVSDVSEVFPGYIFGFVRTPVQMTKFDLVNLKSYEIDGGRTVACPDIVDQTLASPSPYLPDSSCEWTIPIPSGRVLTITIYELDIETSATDSAACPYDYLMVNDVRYCGDWVPPELEVTIENQNSAMIKFVSDVDVEKDGFKLRYRISDNNQPTQPDQRIHCTQTEAGCCSNYCQHGYQNYLTKGCPRTCTCKQSLEVDCGLEFECDVAWSKGAYDCPYCACLNVQKLNDMFEGNVDVDRTCIQTMSMASGIIGSSLVDGYYRNNEDCSATIAMSMGPVYLLLAYDLEGERTCSFDSLSFDQIKFCRKGTHLFRIDQTSDLIVTFTSDGSEVFHGYIMGFVHSSVQINKFDILNLKNYEVGGGGGGNGPPVDPAMIDAAYEMALNIVSEVENIAETIYTLYG